MDRQALSRLLEALRAGTIEVDEATDRIASLGTADLGFARIDRHRLVRRGMPEVILGEGKSPEQIVGIVDALAESGDPVLVTRVTPEVGVQLFRRHPRGEHSAAARCFALKPLESGEEAGAAASPPLEGLLIVSAGTGDIPAAEEAAFTARFLGLSVEQIFDVGVAGLHRLLDQLDRLRRARVIIVAAGMEGALPSVVTGLVECPVIGLPTSVGYGAAAGGRAALAAMLSSCAGGLVVVNVDNGFGAACAARSMLALGGAIR